jgi:hypothetical protein
MSCSADDDDDDHDDDDDDDADDDDTGGFKAVINYTESILPHTLCGPEFYATIIYIASNTHNYTLRVSFYTPFCSNS